MLERVLTLIFIYTIVLSFPHAGLAQQRDETGIQLRDDISTLKKDVTTIGEQQRQIIDQLNELKHLLPSSAVRPAPQPPSTLDIHGENFRGHSGARIAIVEYADFECPFCGQFARQVYPQISDRYIKTGKVKYFYRDLPFHPHATSAARAARCAGEQGKYWEMHDGLFASQAALSNPVLLDRAETVGLDATKFSECLSSDKYSDDLRKSMAEAQRMGIDGTPTFFVGTIGPDGDVVKISGRINGNGSYETFESALDDALAKKSQEAVSTH